MFLVSIDNQSLRFGAIVKSRLFMAAICLLLFFLPAVISGEAACAEVVDVYFYSSESNINNFKFLKMEFDNYLASHGAFRFQPFRDRSTFEQYIKNKNRCLILLSSWHYNNIYRDFHLKAKLVGTWNRKNTRKKVLLSLKKYGELDYDHVWPVASSSSLRHTKSFLEDMFHKKMPDDPSLILKVPKDIDALMSLGFGVSRSAFSSELSLERLSALNPVLKNELRVIHSGIDFLLPVLSVPEAFVPESKKIVAIVYEIFQKPDGVKLLKMLGMDGFQPVDDNIRLQLEN